MRKYGNGFLYFAHKKYSVTPNIYFFIFALKSNENNLLLGYLDFKFKIRTPALLNIIDNHRKCFCLRFNENNVCYKIN